MKTRIQSQNFGNELTVKFQLLEKVYIYPTHIHQYAELFVVLDGDLDITVGDKTEPILPGQAAFVFPFQPHSYHSKRTNKVAIIVFSPSFLPDFFGKTSGKIGSSSVFTPQSSTMKLFCDRIVEKKSFEFFDSKGVLYLMLSDFLENTPLCASTAYNNIASGTVEYINEHITENITLSDLAKHLGYNPNYLSAKIKETFGIALPALIAGIRADKARYLLIESDKSGLEICFECGFGSERSFHRQFKAITGRTPKEYRKMFNTKQINHGVKKYF